MVLLWCANCIVKLIFHSTVFFVWYIQCRFQGSVDCAVFCSILQYFAICFSLLQCVMQCTYIARSAEHIAERYQWRVQCCNWTLGRIMHVLRSHQHKPKYGTKHGFHRITLFPKTETNTDSNTCATLAPQQTPLPTTNTKHTWRDCAVHVLPLWGNFLR